MTLLLDIETCPAWLDPGLPLPERFLLEALLSRREAAPVRWKRIDASGMPGAEPVSPKDKEEFATEGLRMLEEAEKLAMAGALSPAEGRIVAIGTQIAGKPDSMRIFWAKTRDQELSALENYVLTTTAGGEPPTTWRGCDFDAPFLAFRAMLHRFTGPWLDVNDLSRWRQTDLNLLIPWTRTYQGARQTPKLSVIAEALGMPPTDDLRGDQVPKLVRAGDFAPIAEHLRCDLARLDWVHARMTQA